MARLQIWEDENSEMVMIEKDGVCIFEGNYWDLPSTSGSGLSDLLDTLGVEHELGTYEYDN